jgi:hypothetical protein
MRDWPTPPLPDTATRLITPTEAVGRLSDRATGDDDGSANQAVGVGTPRTAPVVGANRGAQRRSAAAVRHGKARSGGHNGTGGRTPATTPTPAPATGGGNAGSAPAATAPATPAAPSPAPIAPVIEAGSAAPTQARPQDGTPQVSVPQVPASPVQVPSVPALSQSPVTGTDDGSSDGNGRRSGHGHRRGPVATLLDALP